MEIQKELVQPPLPSTPPVLPSPPAPGLGSEIENLPLDIQRKVIHQIKVVTEESRERIHQLERALREALTLKATPERSVYQPSHIEDVVAPSIIGSASNEVERYDPTKPLVGPSWGEYGRGTVLRLNADLSNLPPRHEPLPSAIIFEGRTLCEKERIKIAITAARVGGFIPPGVFTDSLESLRTLFDNLKIREARQREVRVRGVPRLHRGRGFRGGRSLFKTVRGRIFKPAHFASGLEAIVSSREQNQTETLMKSLEECQKSLKEAQTLNSSLSAQINQLVQNEQRNQRDLVRIRGERERLRVELSAAKGTLAQSGISLPHIPLPPESVYNPGNKLS